MMEKQLLQSSFGPLVNKPVPSCTDFSHDKDIVEYAEVEVIEKTGEGPHDFVVKKIVQESSRMNRQEYINSFSDEVGIKNILKKVNITGDLTLLNQRGVSVNTDLVDTTQFPTNKIDAYKAVEEGVNAFDKLPDEVKSKMSLESFVESFDQSKFDEYILKQAAIIKAKTEKKDGE